MTTTHDLDTKDEIDFVLTRLDDCGLGEFAAAFMEVTDRPGTYSTRRRKMSRAAMSRYLGLSTHQFDRHLERCRQVLGITG